MAPDSDMCKLRVRPIRWLGYLSGKDTGVIVIVIVALAESGLSVSLILLAAKNKPQA